MRALLPHLRLATRRTAALLALCAALACAPPCSAQSTPRDGDVFFTRDLSFKIPFDPLPPDSTVVEVRLYYSSDGGQTWKYATKARPNDRTFPFTAGREGLYYFATQTVDTQNRLFPVDFRQVAPSLKVRIITSNPTVYVQQIAPREGCSLAVQWNIPEDVTDPNSVVVEYRTVGSTIWTPLADAPRLLNASYHWNPALPGPLEVRVRVRDKVNNRGEQILQLQGPGARGSGPRPPDAANDEVKYVNSQDLVFKYNVEEAGPSGVKEVEVWMTEDKETWTKVQTQNDAKAPITYHAPREGRFGFRLVAVSGVGKAAGRPGRGSQPSFWVEVDTTAPVVELPLAPEVSGNYSSRQVTIRWSATDKNLAHNSVRILYASDKSGPWLLIADNRPDKGIHVWQVNKDIGARVYIRVEAVDRAGNTGQASTPNEVVIDLAEPKVTDVHVGPSKGGVTDLPRNP
jgi:hypothetical protein